MSHPSSPRAGIHWNMIVVLCAEHGEHKVIVAGLDDLADEMADNAVTDLRDEGFAVHRLHHFMPIDDAQRAAKKGFDIDDLPF